MNENDLKITRILKAPRASVWKAWTDPARVVKWWAPAPIITTFQKFDLRPGGAMNSTMRLEDGTEMVGKGSFLDVVAAERIVFTDILEEGWRPAANPFFVAIITMEDHPDGTLYTARAMHRTPEDRDRHAEMGFEGGWGTVAEQLGAFAATL